MEFAAAQVWASAALGARYSATDPNPETETVHLTDIILEFIVFETFSSIWYWMAVAVTWAVVSHWVLGVPFDVILRARKAGPEAMDDLEALFRTHVRRLIWIEDFAGPFVIATTAFALTAIGMAGFYYGMELAQGVFLIGFPVTIVAIITQRACRRFTANPPAREDLARELLRLRIVIQVIAAISIFVTSFYGMYYNLTTSAAFF